MESTDSSSGLDSANRVLLYLLLGMAVFRVLLAVLIPITGDEAYHLEWARHLDWCYYDHPGMVAWLMKPFLVVFGENIVAVRAWGIICGMLLCVVCYRLASEMYPSDRTALRSTVAAGLLPVLAVGSVLASTDAPLNVFWALALLFFYRASESGRMRDWALTGVCLGGAFLSKFLAFGFLPAAALYLVIPRENRRHLKTPGPWVAAGICAALFLPVLLWNHNHGWLTFRFNFLSRQAEMSFSPTNFLIFVAGQLFLFSPVVLAACAYHFARDARRCLDDRKELFLLLFAGLPLVGFALVSLVREIGGHWTAMAMIPLAICFVRATGPGGQPGGDAAGSRGTRSRAYVAGLVAAGVCSLIPVVIVIGLLLAGPERVYGGLGGLQPSEEKRLRNVGKLYGTKTIAGTVSELEGARGDFYATGSYALSSLLTYRSSDKRHYYVWGSSSVFGQNYDLWDDPRRLEGKTMVFIDYRHRTGEEFIRRMLPHFESLVLHHFNRDEGGDLVRALASPKVTAVRHEGPLECGAFVVIRGDRFSGRPIDGVP